MTSPYTRLKELGIELPDVPSPSGNYVHATRTGKLLFLAGKGVGQYTGKVGSDVTPDQAYDFARTTGIMLISVIHQELGDLNLVTKVIKVLGFVNAVPTFTEHPKVINGCSDLFVSVFGERGRHSRTAIGVGSTPFQIPLEIEMILEFA